jgi:hypothetical protein
MKLLTDAFLGLWYLLPLFLFGFTVAVLCALAERIAAKPSIDKWLTLAPFIGVVFVILIILSKAPH